MVPVTFHSHVVLAGEHLLVDKATMRRVIEDLETRPEHYKPLRGRLQGHYRYRVDDVRIVYRYDPRAPAPAVMVLVIGKRRDDEVYATAESRV